MSLGGTVQIVERDLCPAAYVTEVFLPRGTPE